MPWNAFHLTLSSGETQEYPYTWNDDHGPQVAEGREFRQSTRGNPLVTNTQVLVRRMDDAIDYAVSITNRGPNVATFELVGGGLT